MERIVSVAIDTPIRPSQRRLAARPKDHLLKQILLDLRLLLVANSVAAWAAAHVSRLTPYDGQPLS